jgi:hypothetical protein
MKIQKVLVAAAVFAVFALTAYACPEGSTSVSAGGDHTNVCCGTNNDGSQCCILCDPGCVCSVNTVGHGNHDVTSLSCNC